MKVATKEVRKVTSLLDEIIEEYKKSHSKKKRDWRTYEQRFAYEIRITYKELKPLVREAAESISRVKGETRGAEKKLTLEEEVLILLIKHLIQKSNRDMSAMLALFSCLSGIDISYKTVERLYSDEQVLCALHNLHVLLLKKKDVKQADCGGDGTGYSLTVKKNYASHAQKLKDKAKTSGKKRKKRSFFFAFNLLDLDSDMYIAVGTSFKSEKEAFDSAIAMAKDVGIDIASIRLDKYYSAQKYVRILGSELGVANVYLIPKRDATVKGPWNWKRMLYKFVQHTEAYLEEYFKRNGCEWGIHQDKKRISWQLGQKREDRLDTANFLTSLWHNLYALH
jgi:transposase